MVNVVGRQCEDDFDECMLAPCLNNGSCINTIGSYSCFCESGFNGSSCEELINYCTPASCYHGICRSEGTHFVCTCNQGFTGKYN